MDAYITYVRSTDQSTAELLQAKSDKIDSDYIATKSSLFSSRPKQEANINYNYLQKRLYQLTHDITVLKPEIMRNNKTLCDSISTYKKAAAAISIAQPDPSHLLGKPLFQPVDALYGGTSRRRKHSRHTSTRRKRKTDRRRRRRARK
jgi:hypothetical protein